MKRLQMLHVRAERLQAVAELSASLAHEIRNPLASIRSATQQLARRRDLSALPADDDERILHGLVVRESDAPRSRRLADFLDFARARVTRIEALDLDLLVRASVALAASHPDRATGVELSVDVEPDLPRVEGDEDLLHRAVFNLVLNALQAVPDHGHVRVRVARASVEQYRVPALTALNAPLVAITVADDGPGIPAELRDRLFEPFVSGKPGGTGLGLPVVHRAVEAHRGVVLVDATPPGTCFTVILPVGTAHAAADPVARGADLATTESSWRAPR